MKKRKMLAMLLAFVMLFSLVAPVSSAVGDGAAEEVFTVDGGTVTAEAGEGQTAAVDFTFKGETTLTSLRVEISVEPFSVVKAESKFDYEYNPDEQLIIVYSADGFEGDTVLFTVTYDVNVDIATAERNNSVAVAYIDATDEEGDTVDATLNPGMIILSNVCRIGDVSMDGEINNADIIMIARYLVHLTSFNDRQMKLADFNQDGTVNNSDLVALARWIVEGGEVPNPTIPEMYTPEAEHVAYDEEENIMYMDNMIIIVFSDEATQEEIDGVINSIEGKVVGKIDLINQYQVEVASRTLEELRSLVEQVEANECVFFAHYDEVYENLEETVASNDPWNGDVDTNDWIDNDVDGSNWGLEAIEVQGAWDYNDKFERIKLGVVDSGFDTTHEDLRDITLPIFYTRNTPSDHGTHVSGIIGATADNGKGLAGIVWNKELICCDWDANPVSTGFPTLSTDNTIYNQLRGAVSSGAKVINFSLGYSGSLSQSWIDKQGKTASGYLAVLSAFPFNDFIIVQSAGNSKVDAINNGLFASITSNNCMSRGRITKEFIMERIFIVGAAQQNGNGYMAADYSNGGSQVNIAAPGTGIYSTIIGGYEFYSGTSMAAPMVTGVCGLVWSVNRNFTGAEVAEIVKSTSIKGAVVDNPASPLTSGDFDMLNARLAVEEAIRRTYPEKNGTLSGKITRAADRNTPIANAKVEVYKDNNVYKTATSDENGNYSFELAEGDYTVKISADGYLDFSSFATVTADEDLYMETFLLIAHSDADSGVASGTVINSLTGAGVSGVSLAVRNNWNNNKTDDSVWTVNVATTTTDDNGNYTLELPLGNYTVIASKDGFVTSSFNIIVQEGTTGNQNGTITPIVSGDNYYITLTWGENPRDMDSHVEGTLSNGEHFHVYYGDMTAYDGDVEVCKLDYDDTSSYGPENVTLNTTTSDTYYYYIYKFAGSGTTGSSQAHVSVKQGNREIAYFNVPTNLGDGDYWNVFAIKNGEIIPGGTITDYADLSYAG